MLIMLILDWLNGSSVQSRVPLLFCISTTPALIWIWTQNQTLANFVLMTMMVMMPLLLMTMIIVIWTQNQTLANSIRVKS